MGGGGVRYGWRDLFSHNEQDQVRNLTTDQYSPRYKLFNYRNYTYALKVGVGVGLGPSLYKVGRGGGELLQVK